MYNHKSLMMTAMILSIKQKFQKKYSLQYKNNLNITNIPEGMLYKPNMIPLVLIAKTSVIQQILDCPLKELIKDDLFQPFQE